MNSTANPSTTKPGAADLVASFAPHVDPNSAPNYAPNYHSAVILLSAGLDSAVNLYLAHRHFAIKLAITFDYGQRAASKEIEGARELCLKLKVPHKVLELPFFKDFTQSSLVNQSLEVPTGAEIDINGLEKSKASASKVWVPNRNGIFLNIAAGFAEGLGAKTIIPGFNVEEAQTFPDNSKEYVRAVDHSLSFSTANSVTVKCFTEDMDKTQIVKTACDLNLPFEAIWPCYLSLEKPCGFCESCQRFKRALVENKLTQLLETLFQTPQSPS